MSRVTTDGMHGILLLDKPEGITSAEVVRRVKRRLHTKTGHLGTLDPFASGLLPICVGEGTKLAPFLNQDDKGYCGVIRLGSRTDSGDRTGAIVATAPVPTPASATDLARVASSFLGEREQVPPMYSAVKREGRPLYDLARQGITVEREARRIRVLRLELRWIAPAALECVVECSKGTYIRVLAEEIAAALGSVGHLEQLRRTRFGRFNVEDATGLEEWENGAAAALLGPSAALPDMVALRLSASEERRARQGSAALLAQLALPEARAAKLLDGEGALVAIVTRASDGTWSYARVFLCA